MRTKVVIGLCALLLLGGCGPHRLSPAEQRQHRREQARKDVAQERKHTAEQAAKRRHDAAQAAREARISREKWLVKQLEKAPLPAGITQIGSWIFVADKSHIDALRHVCQDRPGTDHYNSGNDVNDVAFLDDGRVKVECKQEQFRWRDITFQNALAAGHIRQPANNEILTVNASPSSVIVEKP